MQFKLTIKMGNDAMQTGEDVAEVLPQIQDWLERGFTSGIVYDYNGNSVGEWSVA